MGNVLGLINLINEKQYLKELTTHRNIASVPFGGRYRLIDFTMSNFINADISLVAVFPKERYLSLMDHLGSGKEWNLDRRSGGLFILPPIQPHESSMGDMKQFHNHLSFFERVNADTVIISPGNHVCKMDYNEILAFHRENQADITVVYKDFYDGAVEKLIYHQCIVNEDGNVTDINLFNVPQAGDHISLETYVISKSLFIDLIKKCAANEEYNFLKDAVKANLHCLNVKGYHFTGDLPFIHSIESFHASNMKFLNPQTLKSFFSEEWSVFTKIKHEPPAKYGQSSNVKNSLVANGCDIEGTVENSILFRGVKVKKGAIVKNSIIMQKGEIEEGAIVENVIADKEVRITKAKKAVGENEPLVIKKAEVI
ncbi:glucose-1-phosphate adenylyltransferase subunit GlgD [Peribacillus asahii]|uniref:Glucose-1-phosphate adenylyltransferase n=1 Tax=Peribacillus asahii TaxID=228899 RepID=A0A3Q9RNJ0_9BACI|nr:glucose-1-phosphate adenylyltransferase subunit GlgD [Peribacillus asahii]AZV43165.1 glucose-1-phosphate adenylyltransferase [Peribacillus asahii]USK83263.1 glucose-1-phosphate adenylyltransferase subunit GlgD [Peribacillus asahii]